MALTTARECAARWGIHEATARRILAPLTQVDRDPTTGAMRYDQEEADAARADQPGRGYRADLSAEAIEAGQLQQLLDDTTIPAAHRALWALLWEGGVRVGDALSLDVRDVDLGDHRVTLDYPKLKSDERAVPISERAADLLHAAKADRADGPLFVDDESRPIGRERAARFAHVAAGAGIHAFRLGGHKARKNPNSKPPSVKFTSFKVDRADAGPGHCQCQCGFVHPFRPDKCGGAADSALLVDVTVISPMTGDPEDRRLRPFCPGCYETVQAQKTAKKELKKIRRGFGLD
ncbi:tyrosine-type recombinase/integrase [Streptomyces olivoreticuli]